MKKILVIDDDFFSRLILFRLLQAKGFNVITAEDGFAGLKKALMLNPDLIISDISMPQINGYQLLKQLRDNLKISHTPFILFYS